MKESSVNRIFSKSAEDAKKVQEVIERRFKTQERMVFKTEREKTPEELEIIEFVDRETNRLAEKYGGEALNIGPKNVHIIMKSEEFADSIDHKASGQKGDWHFRKSGFAINTRKGEKTFEDLDEGVVEFLRRKIMEEWVRSPENLPRPIQEKLRGLGEREIKDQFYAPTYLEYQIDLMRLMKKIQEKHPKMFKNRDDVFEVFAKAAFSGKILDLRKLIDQTFGHGSFVNFAREGLPSELPMEKQGGGEKPPVMPEATAKITEQAIPMADYGANLFKFIGTLTHEYLHMKMYQALEKNKN